MPRQLRLQDPCALCHAMPRGDRREKDLDRPDMGARLRRGMTLPVEALAAAPQGRTSDLLSRWLGTRRWAWVAALGMMALASPGLQAQPANDLFANAEIIPDDFTYGGISATNYRATTESGEPTHSGVPQRRSIWYSWTPQFHGQAQFQVNRYGMGLAVYTGGSILSLQQVAMDRGIGASLPVNFEAQPGVTYRIVIWSAGTTDPGAAFQWSFQLETFNFVLPPEADGPLRTGWDVRLAVEDPDGQLDIGEVEYRANGRAMAWAYVDPWEAVGTPPEAGGVAWQALVTDVMGRRHYSFPVTRMVYSGNDDFAEAAVVEVVAGAAQWTAVDKLATAEPGEPAHGGSPARRSLWWQWTPVCSGRASVGAITQLSPNYLIRLAVYTGADFAGLQAVPLQPSPDYANTAWFDVVGGVPYAVATEGDLVQTNTYVVGLGHLTTQVYPPGVDRLLPGEPAVVVGTNHYSPTLPLSFELAESGNLSIASQPAAPYQFTWTPPEPGVYTLTAVATNEPGWVTRSEPTRFYVAPRNDPFARAETITGPGRWVTVWASLATSEPGEPAHGGQSAEQTLWWRWTPSVSGLASVTRETDNGQFAVYEGDSLTALALVADSHTGDGLPGHGPLQFMAEAGRAYRFAFSRQATSWSEVAWNLGLDTFLFQSPVTGARLPQGAAVTLEARENDAASPIQSVTFAAYAEAALPQALVTNLVVSSGPFRVAWVPPQPGVYVLAATAARPDGSAGPTAPPRTLTVYPLNDAFSQAAPFQAALAGWRAAGSTGGSSLEGPETPMDQAGGTVWHQFEAPATAEFALTMVDGGNQNTKVSVFDGSQLDALQLVAEANAGQWCKFEARAGQRLSVAVRGRRWALGNGSALGGPYELRLLQLAPHDRFEQALPLSFTDSGAGYQVARFGCTNEFATIEPEELRMEDFPWVATGPLSGTLWWQWAAPADGELWVEDIGGEGGPARAGIFTGSDLAHLTDLALSLTAPNYPQRAVVQRGVTYRIAVAGPDFLASPHSRFQGAAYFVPGTPPANGQFATRQPLSGVSVTASGTLLAAPRQTVWYTWTAPAAGILTVTARSSTYTPVIGLYFGDAPDRLTAVTPDIGATGLGTMDARVNGGDVVQIAVLEPGRSSFLEYRLAPFDLRIELSTPTRPANDRPAAPVELTQADWRLEGRIDGAVPEPNASYAYARGGTRWWRWVAPTEGAISVDLLRADMPAQIALYTPGLWGFDLFLLGATSTTAGPAVAEVTAGQVCLISVSSPVRLLGAYSLQGTFLTAARNDFFADRKPVIGNPVAVGGYCGGATREPDEPVHDPAGKGQTLWWTWTAPTNGQLTITYQGRGFSVVAYTGDALPNLQPVARSEWGSPMRFPVVRGRIYQLAAENLSDVAGYVSLNFDFRPNPPDAGRLTLYSWRWDGLPWWQLNAPDGFNYVLEASDLSSPWQAVQILGTLGGVTYFVDEDFRNRPCRFYRVRVQD